MRNIRAFAEQLRLRPKLIAAMVVAGLGPLLIASFLVFQTTQDALRKQTFDQLDSLLAVKRGAIENYFRQIENQAAALANDPSVKDAVGEFSDRFQRLAEESSAEVKLATLNTALTRHYNDIFAKEFAKQSGTRVTAESLIPADLNNRVAQYYYIADNKNAAGEKDKLQEVAGTASYHRVHAKYHPVFSDFQKRFGYYDLFLIDTSGNVVYTVFKEVDFATNLNANAVERTGLARAFEAAMNAKAPGETFIEDLAAYRASYDAPASFIAAPIFHDGKKIGVVALQMPMGKINEIMQESTGLGETGETYLVGADGLMRSQSRIDKTPGVLKTKVANAAVGEAVKGKSGHGNYMDRHGGDVYGAYAPVKLNGLNWGMVAEIDSAEAEAAEVTLMRKLSGTTLAVAVIVSLFAWRFGSRLSGRITSSVAIANRVAQGQFDNTIVIDAKDEIGELQQALNTMQTELFGRIVREKNDAFRIGQALEVATANVMVADADRRIVFMNRSVTELFTEIQDDIRKDLPQFDSRNIIGGSIDQFHKNPAHQTRMLSALRNTHSAEISVGTRTMRIIATPIFDPKGERLGTVVEWTDLTDQRNAEKQIQSAIAEAVAGKLSTRLDVTAFQGFLGTMAEGVNAMLDALVTPLTVAADYLKKIADGEIPQMDIQEDFKGDFSAMKQNLNTCAQVLRTLLHDASRLTDAALAGRLDERADLSQHWGDFQRIVQGMNGTLDAFNTPVMEIKQVMSGLAAGDLQRQVTGQYQGEFAVLAGAVNTCVATLSDMVKKIQVAAYAIGNSSSEIAKGNQDLSVRTEEQASSLQSTAATMEQLTGTVKTNADNATQANQLAVGARTEAQQGGTVVAQAVEAMAQINKASTRIADIIGVIDEIAFQTNLLALNAAVEAARAGEHGRGFAVVASEVRNLAQRSAVAAKEIKQLINDSVAKVEDGSRLVDESGLKLNAIVNAVKKVSDIVGEIASASAEQSDGIEQINKSVIQMEQATQQNAALVEESAAASERMDEEAQGLTELVAFFKLDGSSPSKVRNAESTPAAERRGAGRAWSKPAAKQPPQVARTDSRATPRTGTTDGWDSF